LSSVDGGNLQVIDRDPKVENPSLAAGAAMKDEQGAKATSASTSAPKTDKSPGAGASSKFVASATEKKESPIIKKAKDATIRAVKILVSLLEKTPGVLWFYLTHPAEFRKKLIQLKEAAVKEAHHYWMGSKVSFSISQSFPVKLLAFITLIYETIVASCCRHPNSPPYPRKNTSWQYIISQGKEATAEDSDRCVSFSTHVNLCTRPLHGACTPVCAQVIPQHATVDISRFTEGGRENERRTSNAY
jgi:hypothetical protein